MIGARTRAYLLGRDHYSGYNRYKCANPETIGVLKFIRVFMLREIVVISRSHGQMIDVKSYLPHINGNLTTLPNHPWGIFSDHPLL